MAVRQRGNNANNNDDEYNIDDYCDYSYCYHYSPYVSDYSRPQL